jgi:hypothetical protein
MPLNPRSVIGSGEPLGWIRTVMSALNTLRTRVEVGRAIGWQF